MEQFKYEERFRKELGQREITPSKESWKKLRGKLDAEENHSARRFMRWTGIAAFLAAGIMIAGFMFFREDKAAVPQVVDSPAGETIQQEERYSGEKEQEVISLVPERKKGAVANREKVPERKVRQPVAVQDDRIASTPEKVRPADPGLIPGEQGIVPAKDNLPLADSSPLENGSEVSDAEIDALLRKASLQLSTERSQEIVKRVNAAVLLEDVESQLEQSFRKKVLEVLQDGFSRAKNAVANRNL